MTEQGDNGTIISHTENVCGFNTNPGWKGHRMEEKQIKAVVFDVGGTLLTFQATEEADRMYITHTMAYLNQHGILLGADPDEVMKHIEAGNGWEL